MKISSTHNLAYMHPELAKEWSTKNTTRSDSVLPGSNKKVWWVCKEGHPDYLSSISHRTNMGCGCPFCSGRQVCYTSSLEYLNPDIAKEWSAKNNLKPDQTTSSSGKIVWWVCKEGHPDYKSIINDRTGRKYGCPYCSGKQVCSTNNMAHKFPHLINEWSTKNEIDPKSIVPGSKKKVWWICPEGHRDYLAGILNRTVNNTGCPRCTHKSKPELEIFEFIKVIYPDAVSRSRSLLKSNKFELDIYINSIRTAVEFDGDFWHHSKWAKDRGSVERDLRKYHQCTQAGIRLFRIKEHEYQNSPHDILDELISFCSQPFGGDK